MGRDWTFVPDYIQEDIQAWLENYNHKMKSKRGFYAAQSKKDMEGWLHEAAHIMKSLASEVKYTSGEEDEDEY